MNAEKRLLVVDDQLMIRTMLKNALRNIGFKDISEAANGLLACQSMEKAFAEGKPFDLVFLDFMMPEMSGLDVLKFCRDNKNLSTTNFIMISAEQSRELVIQAAELGVKAYIVKPFDMATLSQKVRSLTEEPNE